MKNKNTWTITGGGVGGKGRELYLNNNKIRGEKQTKKTPNKTFS